MTPFGIAFIVFAAIVGAASGIAVLRYPAANDFALPPMLWVVVAMALFELALGYARGVPLGTLITMPQRLIGLVIGYALLLGIPALAPQFTG